MFAPVPKPIDEFLKNLREKGVPMHAGDLSEEEQSVPLTFAEEIDHDLVESNSWTPLRVESTGEKVVFRAFLDGVQRTMMLPRRVLLKNGALVPLHIAHIAAGVLLRDDSGRLHMDPGLVAARLLLLGPFEGIRDAGGERFEVDDEMLDTSDRTFAFPNEVNEWLVCDTTFRGTDIDRHKREEGALLRDKLFNEGRIRARAQGRVATLRQRLEFSVLAKFRGKYPDDYILVDGPLFFLGKGRKGAENVLRPELEPLLCRSDEGSFEYVLLKNAVGLIKTHRLRPKNPESVMRIGQGQRSPVGRFSKEVDVKGQSREPDEEGGYGEAHLTWYTRLRLPHGDPTLPSGLQGLVRLDVHRSTFGIRRVDALSPENFGPYRQYVDRITRAVWGECWPGLHRTGESKFGNQIYPIEQLEKVLKARLYPRRLLAHLWSLAQ